LCHRDHQYVFRISSLWQFVGNELQHL